MKIAIVGAGAIGGLFGSILSKNGMNVTLVDIWAEHVRVMQASGLTVVDGKEEETVKVKATTNIEDVGTPDLIILSVKSYDTEQAARDCLRIIGPESLIMTVQNGVGNVAKISEVLGRDRVIAGTTSFGSTMLGPGRIQPNGKGKINIGELDGRKTPRLHNVVNTLIKGGIDTEIVLGGVDNLIWTKLVVNVGINALTSITELRNGELLEYQETKLLQALVVEETKAVAQAQGIRFNVEDPLQHVMEIARDTYNNKSSMLQDIERGAKTEIDFINGAIVTEGKKRDIPTPVNEVLTLLVKTIEKRVLRQA